MNSNLRSLSKRHVLLDIIQSVSQSQSLPSSYNFGLLFGGSLSPIINALSQPNQQDLCLELRQMMLMEFFLKALQCVTWESKKR